MTLTPNIVDQQTNMVFVRLPQACGSALRSHLADRGIRILDSNPLRLVTHQNVSRDDVETTIEAFEAFFR